MRTYNANRILQGPLASLISVAPFWRTHCYIVTKSLKVSSATGTRPGKHYFRERGESSGTKSGFKSSSDHPNFLSRRQDSQPGNEDPSTEAGKVAQRFVYGRRDSGWHERKFSFRIGVRLKPVCGWGKQRGQARTNKSLRNVISIAVPRWSTALRGIQTTASIRVSDRRVRTKFRACQSY